MWDHLFRIPQRWPLGCSYDYIAFEKELEPLIANIHGEIKHRGKVSPRHPEGTESLTEVIKLRREMKEAITQEEYERASQLRDQIRKLEQSGKE